MINKWLFSITIGILHDLVHSPHYKNYTILVSITNLVFKILFETKVTYARMDIVMNEFG